MYNPNRVVCNLVLVWEFFFTHQIIGCWNAGINGIIVLNYRVREREWPQKKSPLILKNSKVYSYIIRTRYMIFWKAYGVDFGFRKTQNQRDNCGPEAFLGFIIRHCVVIHLRFSRLFHLLNNIIAPLPPQQILQHFFVSKLSVFLGIRLIQEKQSKVEYI